MLFLLSPHRFLLQYPLSAGQCHPGHDVTTMLGKAASQLSQRVHPSVIARIKECVVAGLRSPRDISNVLKMESTAGLSRAYHPHAKDVRWHVFSSLRSLQMSVVDQLELGMKVL